MRLSITFLLPKHKHVSKHVCEMLKNVTCFVHDSMANNCMRSPQCHIFPIIQPIIINNIWLTWNMYHNMYNDGTSPRQFVLTVCHVRGCGCKFFSPFSIVSDRNDGMASYSYWLIVFFVYFLVFPKKMSSFEIAEAIGSRGYSTVHLGGGEKKKIKPANVLQQVQWLFSPFFHTATKGTDDEGFTISHIPMSDFHDVLAYLNKLNLVISFLQIEFLRGFKWANYEWCHGRECSNYQQCGEKWVWKQTRGIGGGLKMWVDWCTFTDNSSKASFSPLHECRPLRSPSRKSKQLVCWALTYLGFKKKKNHLPPISFVHF